MRRASSKQSLNRKFTLIVVASVMAAVAVIAFASMWQETRRHTLAKLNYLSATAAVFASATSHAVALNNANDAMFALRGVARAPDLLHARVENSTGVTLAQIGSGISLDTDTRLTEDEAGSVIDALSSRTIAVSAPIIQGGETVGEITLVADNSGLVAALMGVLLQTLLGAAAALLVAVPVAARMQRWVSQPLLRLTAAVREISKSHDYNARVDIVSDDEVGDLCSGFNVMLGEIKDRERRIIDLALHDSDTDLPTRLAFERELAARIAAPRGRVVVVALSVDRFQYVRSLVGYHLANDLLGELGARALMAAPGSMAARVSTDVVGCVFEAADEEAALAIAAELLAEAEAPIQLGADTLDINVTLGLVIQGVHADTPQGLIEHASIALDQARAGRVKISPFDDALYQQTASNLSLMTDLMRALENGEMSLNLQPKFDLRRGELCGAEVLSRWMNAQRGPVSPDTFVTMAEETGVIGPFTLWVLRETIACQHRLATHGLDPTLAVNISGKLIGDLEFVDTAARLITESPHPIYLEITETASIDNQNLALANINALVAAGARISIDDYGAGLSSLAYLKRIPAHELKIDKGFISALGHQQRDALLVKSTIDLAHSLGMKVTAEGVEDESTMAILARMGCDRVQGYFVGKPMREADFVAFAQGQSKEARETA
ncbi:MAG: putative bifunctional diguanylate cyclase/phosphodiesterase [Hyphomonadaceae bacterium]